MSYDNRTRPDSYKEFWDRQKQQVVDDLLEQIISKKLCPPKYNCDHDNIKEKDCISCWLEWIK